MKFKRQRNAEVSVNLTPLIDVVFLLLIFFMVSTTFTRESRLQVNLPEASAEAAPQEAIALEIVIDAGNRYAVNGRSLARQDLETLKQALRISAGDEDTNPTVLISADAAASHQAVIRAMDAAGQLGFSQLSISTLESADNAAAPTDGS